MWRPRARTKLLVLLLAWTRRNTLVGSARCNSQEVTSPIARNESTGWVSQDLGAGQRRQGHVTGEVVVGDEEVLVVYGGTNIRNDDVNHVTAKTTNVSLLTSTTGSAQIWTQLEMIGYEGSPPALFRSGSFVWRNSLFLIGGHTSTPFTATPKIWRADIEAFVEAPEGLWRSVNATVASESASDAAPEGMYGHTATMLVTDDSDPDEIWVAVIGGMTAYQESVEANYILHVADTGEDFECVEYALPASSTYNCADRAHTRPADSQGKWWDLSARLSPGTSSGPAQRAYHAAASIATDGAGNSACVYMYGGRDYEKSIMYSDLWRLCPVGGYLGNSADTKFWWTELKPTGKLPKGRYGHTLYTGFVDGSFRILLYGGTGRYPNAYMDDDFSHEYDTVLNAWLDTPLADGSVSTPAGRRDHTFEGVGDLMILIAGIDNDDEALQDMWNINFSNPVCSEGSYMFFCQSTSAPVCGTCPNGTAALRASYECELCDSGYYALSGSSECTPCPSGTYGAGDGGVIKATACTACPAGTFATSVGTASVDGCLACTAGTYSETGAETCLKCPDGFYSDEGASECTACPKGNFRKSTSSSGYCDPCPAGTYAPFAQTTHCLDCPRGFYSEEGGATTCSPCPAGTKGENIAGGGAANACRDCAAGEYSTEEGSVSCQQCPAGTASAAEGASTSGVCAICGIGSFAPAGSSSCQDCRAGGYGVSTGAESCELCPTGTYLIATGATTADVCELCPEGSTTLAAGSNSSSECTPCPPGTHSVRLIDGGGCKDCLRGEYTATSEEAQGLNCTMCDGGFYGDTTGLDECPACPEGELSYNAHALCSPCDKNQTCPLGPNGEFCSNLGTCFLNVCSCTDGFNGVDCSDGTCDGCGGVFGFAFESTATEILESSGSVTLTLIRLAGTDGDMVVTVDVTGGNVTQGLDYGGIWPTEVNFAAGQSSALLNVPIVHDDDPDEGCEVLVVGVTDVTGVNGSVVVVGGIHDVSAQAIVAIDEVDFSSRVLEAEARVDAEERAGGLSPATAKVIIADAAATWPSNVSLSLVGTTPSNRSMALPLDVLILAEADVRMSAAIGNLADLLPGFAAEMQSNVSSTAFGVAAFASSSYFEVVESLNTNVNFAAEALSEVNQSSRALSSSPPGSQWLGLFTAADDETNDVGWRTEAFRIAAVVTGSPYASATDYVSTDATTWNPPDSITLTGLKSQLSGAGVHPLFLVINESLETEYQALVRELGFGAAVPVDETAAAANNYNDFYLPWALLKGLKALYEQAALLVSSDEGNFVTSLSPPDDASRSEPMGTAVEFQLNLSSTASSDVGGGEVELCFQGHKTVISVVREKNSCEVAALDRTSGDGVAEADSKRAGWVQEFYSDEDTKWVFGSAFSIVNETRGPFGVSSRALLVSCLGGCTNEEAYIDLIVDYDSEMALVLKAYFFPYADAQVTGATATLDVTYGDGSTGARAAVLDFEDAVDGAWMQGIVAVYPTEVITAARVILSSSGSGTAYFAGVGLFAHPDAACRCDAGYYLDISSAPGNDDKSVEMLNAVARIYCDRNFRSLLRHNRSYSNLFNTHKNTRARTCTPQPECTFFDGSCTYCPAGYKCPHGGVLTACMDGMYSMGGYTECSPCPVGWLCSNGLAVPCGYGSTMSAKTTGAQEEEGSSSSASGTYGGRCITCPAGSACPGGGVFEECWPGTFAPGGSASILCQPCEPGTYSNNSAAGECDLCPAGLTSNYGSAECYECPGGAFSARGQHPCNTCSLGTYSSGGSSECTPCPIGYYASRVSMSVCEECPGSTTTTSEGSISVDDCV